MRRWWLAIALGACTAGGPGSADTDTDRLGETDLAPARVVDPLQADVYRFCHEVRVDADEMARFCDLLRDAPEDACPGMRKTCEDRVFEGISSAGCAGGGGSPARGFGDLGEPPTPTPDVDWSLELGEGVEAALRWGFALLAAFVLLAVASWLLARLGLRRRPEVQAPVLGGEVGELAAEDPAAPASPAARLLAAARAAADEGRAEEAIVLARAASLRQLADDGRVALHRSRTDREYLADLRRDRETAGAWRVVLRAVEQVRWARNPVRSEDVERALGAAAQLVRLGLVALLAWSPAAEASSSRWGPWGDAGLRELLRGAGYEVVAGVNDFDALDDTHDVLWLDLLFVEPSWEEWTEVRDWVDAGGVLVVGGDPSDGLFLPGHMRRSTAGPRDVVRRVFWYDETPEERFTLVDEVPVWPNGSTYEWCVWNLDDAYTVVAQDDDAVRPLDLVAADTDRGDTDLVHTDVEDTGSAHTDLDPTDGDDSDARDTDPGPPPCVQRALISLHPLGAGAIVLVSDASLFANASLILRQNRDALVRLPRMPERLGLVALPARPRVVLATASRTSGPPSSMGSVANPLLLPFLLQLLVLWGLAVLWLGRSRVPPRDPPTEGRLDLLAHIDALADQARRTGDEAWAASRMARWAVAQWGPDGLEHAARSAGRSVEDARRWRQWIQAVASGEAQADLSLVEELWTTLGRHPSR